MELYQSQLTVSAAHSLVAMQKKMCTMNDCGILATSALMETSQYRHRWEEEFPIWAIFFCLKVREAPVCMCAGNEMIASV